MNGMVAQFKHFLLKQNALALAIGVIIGGAIGKVVTGIVEDIFMPIISLVMPGGGWREAELHLTHTAAIKYGDLLGRFIDFTIISGVVFLVLRIALADQLKEPPAAEPTKVCPECLEKIPLAARRCKACASPQPPNVAPPTASPAKPA
jgi:large conductance mechanosensitive channel